MSTVRIVIADDHAVVRAGIANALREMDDIEIVGEANDGITLLSALDETHPDMLVTDVTMPNFEPIETIRNIHLRFPDLKILVVSAFDDDVYVQGLFRAGVHGYHLKDQPLSDLRLAVQRLLAGERWICGRLVDKLVYAHEASSPALRLTSRQHELLCLLNDGLDNYGIARRTSLSIKTIENHLTRLYRLINVQSRLEAVHYSAEHPDILGTSKASPYHPPTHDNGNDIRATILIVDDNTRYRTQLRRMVAKCSPSVVVYEAQNTASALQTVADVRPYLVFVDVVLGDEHGIDCVGQIKALAPTTRVVLISAYPDREFSRAGIAAGAVAFLDKKDLNSATLREVIADLST